MINDHAMISILPQGLPDDADYAQIKQHSVIVLNIQVMT
jgi:hypothetical protein